MNPQKSVGQQLLEVKSLRGMEFLGASALMIFMPLIGYAVFDYLVYEEWTLVMVALSAAGVAAAFVPRFYAQVMSRAFLGGNLVWLSLVFLTNVAVVGAIGYNTGLDNELFVATPFIITTLVQFGLFARLLKMIDTSSLEQKTNIARCISHPCQLRCSLRRVRRHRITTRTCVCGASCSTGTRSVTVSRLKKALKDA